MNNFSCSLSSTWMTIINCLFYASGSLTRDVSLEYTAILLVAWLYMVNTFPARGDYCRLLISFAILLYRVKP